MLKPYEWKLTIPTLQSVFRFTAFQKAQNFKYHNWTPYHIIILSFSGNYSQIYNNPRSNTWKNNQTCIYCKIQGYCQHDYQKRIRDKKPYLYIEGHPFWPKIKSTSNYNTDEKGPISSINSVSNLIQSLLRAPVVTSELVMSLCTISILTCNLIGDAMTTSLVVKTRPRINITTGFKTYEWLFDSGTAVTYVTSSAFLD